MNPLSWQKRLRPLLTPVSLLYRRILAARRAKWENEGSPAFRPACQCVSVGNIAWGGTGKTPVVDWLLGWSEARGLRAVVLSRGYKAQPPELPLHVSPSRTPGEAGDEPLMLALEHPSAAVMVDPDRRRSGRWAEERLSPDLFVLDDGWSDPKAGDVMSVVEQIDLPELVRYADAKGVGLMLWVVGNVLDAKLEEACSYYAGLGIRGFKVDFIDRDDQKAVELVYRLARVAAAHRLVLDIHGVYKPTGQNRTYPNIVNFESVFGLEELKWSNPDMPLYDVTFPFIRMVQGPVDYTPGAYRNATREGFRIDYRNPMSQGTRAHQVAAYVVFDAPLVMLCDSPTRYMADEACTRFIASLPVVFDTTRVLAGEIGEYIVTARKRQDCWYVGGLTGWTPRTLDVDLSLLDPGREYTATLLADDGRSAAEPTRYTISTQRVTSATRLQIPVAPGGGFALKIEPADNK